MAFVMASCMASLEFRLNQCVCLQFGSSGNLVDGSLKAKNGLLTADEKGSCMISNMLMLFSIPPNTRRCEVLGSRDTTSIN